MQLADGKLVAVDVVDLVGKEDAGGEESVRGEEKLGKVITVVEGKDPVELFLDV
jgi:hypothetical protein